MAKSKQEPAGEEKVKQEQEAVEQEAVEQEAPAKPKKSTKAHWGDDQPPFSEHLKALHENNPNHPGSRAQKALLAKG